MRKSATAFRIFIRSFFVRVYFEVRHTDTWHLHIFLLAVADRKEWSFERSRDCKEKYRNPHEKWGVSNVDLRQNRINEIVVGEAKSASYQHGQPRQKDKQIKNNKQQYQIIIL